MTTLYSQLVYELALSIPKGTVVTYGDLARAAGGGGQAARGIGRILAKAPNQGAIPWHRIVYANGTVWFSPEGEKERRALYEREGIEVDAKGKILNFDEVHYSFT